MNLDSYNMGENIFLYNIIESTKTNLAVFNNMINWYQHINMPKQECFTDIFIERYIKANNSLLDRISKNYKKPEFAIKTTKVNGKDIAIKEVVKYLKPFCQLIHFKKMSKIQLPKLLIVAPMAGHHATLLRNTVEETLPFFDVFITDWVDAKLVPIGAGSFDLDDYIDYMIEFFAYLGPGTHVMAVCQPVVPVLAAVSIMEEQKNNNTPTSMILIGGPVDSRYNPTKVNFFAIERSIAWFENNLITRVPINYPGFMRRVYPGFLQLMGFISMNANKHYDEHYNYFINILKGDVEKVERHHKFYNEYFAVMDLPAEFYLQTIQLVFQQHALPLGKMISRGRKVNPAAIKKTALIGIEGELDDIAGVGQTKASLDLCVNIPSKFKQYHLQKGVGHYGVFSGSKFRDNIVPKIVDFTRFVDKSKK